MTPAVVGWGLAVVCVAACWTDLRSRRIPNWLTFGGFLSALMVRFLLGVPAGLDGLWGGSVALLLAVPAMALGAFGGGDAKLLVAVGAYVGLARLPGALLAIGIIGGLLALFDAVRRGTIIPSLLQAGDLIKYIVTLGRSGARRTLQSPDANAIPYGVAIAIGAVWGWIAGG